jgi:hypothetical protein
VPRIRPLNNSPFITLPAFTFSPIGLSGTGAYRALQDYVSVSCSVGLGGASPDHIRIANFNITYTGLGKAEAIDCDSNLQGAAGGALDGSAITGTVTINHATAGGFGTYLSNVVQDVVGGSAATFEWARASTKKNLAGSVARILRLISGGSQPVDQGIRMEGAFTDAFTLGNPPDGATRVFNLNGNGKITIHNGISSSLGGGSIIQTLTKAGTPTDSDFTNPADGLIVVDTTAGKIWTRIGGTWKGVAVA